MKNSINAEKMECLYNVDPTIYGFGRPSEMTFNLIKDGLIEIDYITENDKEYWKAALTDKAYKLAPSLKNKR